jgi:hypothetical protein
MGAMEVSDADVKDAGAQRGTVVTWPSDAGRQGGQVRKIEGVAHGKLT